MKAHRIILTMLFVGICSFGIYAQSINEIAKILPTPNQKYSRAGEAIAIDGNIAVVGDPGYEEIYENGGAAYVLEYNGTNWNKIATLTASDPSIGGGDEFGSSVAISGNTIVVGAPSSGDGGVASGAVYVYEMPAGGWTDMTETQKLVPSDLATIDRFGIGVAISGTTIVATKRGDGSGNIGAAYVYENSGTWTQVDKLMPATILSTDFFGSSVALEGTTLVVGASQRTGGGSTFIFENTTGWNEVAELTASDRVSSDLFGISVAISGSTVVAGASRDHISGTDEGSAYVFEKPVGGWIDMTETQKLVASDVASFDYFGESVSISGSSILIGSRLSDPNGLINSGAAYVYEYNDGSSSWIEGAILTATGGVAHDNMGIGTAISGDQILIGGGSKLYAHTRPVGGWNTASLSSIQVTPLSNAHDSFGGIISIDGNTAVVSAIRSDNLLAGDVGGVYVLEYDGASWSIVAKLAPSDGAEDDSFGYDIAIDGTTIVVGAPFSDPSSRQNAGAVYVFEQPMGGWVDMIETQKLTHSVIDNNDQFGTSVSVSGDRVVVGAPKDDGSKGSVVVFQKSGTWIEEITLEASDRISGDRLGQSVNISGTTVVSGASGDDTSQGSVYVFEFDGSWSEIAKLTASDGADYDSFGQSLDMVDNTIAVGAYAADGVTTQTGVVYIFEKPGAVWTSVTETQKLMPSDGALDDRFGIHLSLSENLLIAGSIFHNTKQGAAYVFANNGAWSFIEKLTASDGLNFDLFGGGVANAGNQILIGSSLHTGTDLESGAVYHFEIDLPPSVTVTGPASPTNSNPIPVTITFSEAVTGFDPVNTPTDITLTNATLSEASTTDNITFTLQIIPTAEGLVEVTVPAAVAIDSGSSDNEESNTYSVTYDIPPSVAITTTSSDPTNTTIPVTITFNETVTGFELSDVAITNGNGSGFTDNGDGSYDLTVTATADGVVEVNVAAGVATDAAGSGNLVSNTLAVTFDGTSPTVVVAENAPNPTKGTIPVTITFDELVTGFDLSDVTITNGNGSDFTDNGDGSYDLTVTAIADGLVEVSVAAAVATDAAGNINTVSNVVGLTYDGTKPTVTVSTTESDPTNNAFIPITVTFSEIVTGFDESDIGLAGISDFTDNGDGTYDFILEAAGDLTFNITIPVGAAFDVAGNNSLVSNTLVITYDGTAPSIAVTSTSTDPTNVAAIPVTITFDEPVTGFIESDITITNGTSSDFTDNGDGSYDLIVTASADGLVEVDVLGGVATDAAENENIASNTLQVTYDGTAPTVAITSTSDDPANEAIPITVAFDELVTGFDLSDVTITNGNGSDFTDNGDGSYDLVVSATANGLVEVNVAAGVATDAAGNSNTVSNTLGVMYDATAPTVTLTTASGDPTNGAIPITVTFDELVTGFDLSDVTITNGNGSGFTDNGDGSYDLTVTATADGLVEVEVSAGVATDAADNGNTASNTLEVTYDATAPTIEIEAAVGSVTNMSTIPVTITFSEIVTGFDEVDLTLTNGTSSDFIDNGDGTYEFNVNALSAGAVSVEVAAGVSIDLAGNTNQASNVLEITYDPTAVAALVTTTSSDPTNIASIPVTIDFGEAVTGFEEADLTLTNGTSSDFTDNGDGTYDLTVTASADGNVVVFVDEGVASDLAGNPNQASNTLTVLYDGTSPDVAITTSAANPTNVMAIPVTIEFSELMSGFDETDITITNGLSSDFMDNGDGSYDLIVTASGDGDVVILVADGVAGDLAGNPNNQAINTLTVTYDGTAPSVAITTSASDPTNIIAIPVTVDFGESVTGFEEADITLTNGVSSDFTDNGDGSYDLLVTASGDGDVWVTIAAAIANDLAGNANQISNTLIVTYDGTAPSPAITTTATNPTNNAVVPVVIDFGESVIGFDESDITITNGSGSEFTNNGDGSYDLNVTASGDGEVNIFIADGVASDLASNPNQASNSLSISYDGTAPTVTILNNGGSVVNTAAIPISITFSENVIGFGEGDILLTNGTSSDFTDNRDGSYSVKVTALSVGMVSISIPAAISSDAAGNSNLASNTLEIDYDPGAVSVTISTDSSDPTNSADIPVTVYFGEVMTGFDASDLMITNGSASNLSDDGGGSFTLTVTATADGLVTIQVPADVASNSSGSSNLSSNTIQLTYDGTAPTAAVTTTSSDPTSIAAIPVTVTFSEGVSGFTIDDVTVRNGAASDFTDNGDNSYDLLVTAAANGLVEVDIAAGAVTDAAGNENTMSNTLQVTYNAPNNSPALVGTIENQSLTISGTTGERVTLTLSDYFTDPDGDALTYTAQSDNVAIATASVSSGSLTVEAVADGTTKITVTADDQRGGQVATDFNVTAITVLSIADKPVEILYYPNPATTDLTIKSDHFDISEWKLYGLRGDLRAYGKGNGESEMIIDVEGFAGGTYILKLISTKEEVVDIRVRINK